MTIQKRNNNLVELLTADFQKRNEPNFAWKSACAAHQALLGLRGFWPMSAFDSGGDCYDQSGHNHVLTYNGAGLYSQENLIPFISCLTAGGIDYLERADEADLDIIGTEAYVLAADRGLTIGCWVRFDNVAAAVENVMAKASGGGAALTSYLIYRNAAGSGKFQVSNGAAAENIGATALAQDTWYHLVGRWDAVDRAVFVNGVKKSAATALAAVNNTAANFQIGGRDDGAAGSTEGLDGDVSLAFLCAAKLPDTVIWSIFQQTRAMFNV